MYTRWGVRNGKWLCRRVNELYQQTKSSRHANERTSEPTKLTIGIFRESILKSPRTMKICHLFAMDVPYCMCVCAHLVACTFICSYCRLWFIRYRMVQFSFPAHTHTHLHKYKQTHSAFGIKIKSYIHTIVYQPKHAQTLPQSRPHSLSLPPSLLR